MDMDVNTIRNGVTLASFVLFLVLATWSWLPARRAGQDDAAQLPFLGEVEASNGGGAHE